MDNVRSLRNQGWAWFDYAVLDTHGAQIKAAGIAVYMVLARHAGNDSQQAFPAVPTIAEKTGMSDRQVKRVLKTLEEAGLIRIEPQYDDAGRQLSNLYTLLPVLSYRGDTQSPSGVTHSHGEGDTQSPKQDSVNKTHRNKRETPAQATGDISLTVPAGTAIKNRPDAPKVLPRPAETLCPPDFTLTSEDKVWAQTNVAPLYSQLAIYTRMFVTHYTVGKGKNERDTNWRGRWQMWMLRQLTDFGTARASAPAPSTRPYTLVKGA